MDLNERLFKAKEEKRLPEIDVFLRIDGPGSSLDLRLFQQAFWKLGRMPQNPLEDPAMNWSNGLPRTVGMSIDVTTKITVEPIEKGKLGVESVDYGFCYVFDKGSIPPRKENWLLRVLEAFDLDGVKFIIRNSDPALKSAGLGGSAAVTTGVCLLANKLTGEKFSQTQLIGMASMMEQDLGVSITGTQEQSSVMYGGIRDYVWFPWGIPGNDSFYGSSIRQELLKEIDYNELRKRMDVYFCLQRFSGDVNAKWREELMKSTGFKIHRSKCELAYMFREGIRTKNWESLATPIEEYRRIRTLLCSSYMSEASVDINELCRQHNAVSFPLGGGGGSVMVYSSDPENILKVREAMPKKFKFIDYKFVPKGHETRNIDTL